MKEKILVSACLLGVNCKYNGKNNYNEKLVKFLLNKKLILPICPEVVVFGKKRKKIWYSNGTGKDIIDKKQNVKMINSSGDVVTEKLLKICRKISKVAKELKIKYAILKERSPSCGVNFVYVNKKLKKGCGLLTALLKEQKIKVISEEQL